MLGLIQEINICNATPKIAVQTLNPNRKQGRWMMAGAFSAIARWEELTWDDLDTDMSSSSTECVNVDGRALRKMKSKVHRQRPSNYHGSFF